MINNANEQKEISHKRIKLRPFKMSDLNDLYEITSDKEVTKFLTWDSHNSIEVTKKSLVERFIPNDNLYAIEYVNENKCIGTIDIRIEKEHNKASFGYMLNRQYWNKGFMTEALELVIDLLFKDYKVNRIESTHYVGNEASGKVMEKCGMQYEGTFPQELIIKGKYVDVVHYGILKKDYIGK